MTEKPLPVVQGDWVARESPSGSHFDVARVKQSYWGSFPGEEDICYADLVPYNTAGRDLKRVSPDEGGPKNFEPSCQISDFGWRRIKRPEFPLKWGTDAMGYQTTLFHGGTGSAQPKEFRTTVRKQSRDYGKASAYKAPSTNLDGEIAALRRSAQELRDQARQIPAAADALIQRASELEAEAKALS